MFDIQRYLSDHFDGQPRILHEALIDVLGDNAPPLDTVRKWHQRMSIPSDGLVASLAALEAAQGAPVSILPYIKRPTCPTLQEKHTPTGTQPSVFD